MCVAQSRHVIPCTFRFTRIVAPPSGVRKILPDICRASASMSPSPACTAAGPPARRFAAQAGDTGNIPTWVSQSTRNGSRLLSRPLLPPRKERTEAVPNVRADPPETASDLRPLEVPLLPCVVACPWTRRASGVARPSCGPPGCAAPEGERRLRWDRMARGGAVPRRRSAGAAWRNVAKRHPRAGG